MRGRLVVQPQVVVLGVVTAVALQREVRITAALAADRRAAIRRPGRRGNGTGAAARDEGDGQDSDRAQAGHRRYLAAVADDGETTGTETIFTWGAPPLKFGAGALDEIGFDVRQYDV